jgi:hypothetical protein
MIEKLTKRCAGSRLLKSSEGMFFDTAGICGGKPHATTSVRLLAIGVGFDRWFDTISKVSN